VAAVKTMQQTWRDYISISSGSSTMKKERPMKKFT
jgi:hypothetical protein